MPRLQRHARARAAAAAQSSDLSSSIVTVLRLGRIVRVVLILMKLNATQAGMKKMRYRALEGGIEAPVFKVLTLLQELATRAEVEADRVHLRWIIDVIGSNRLYQAVLSPKSSGNKMDTQTEAWLKSQYAVVAAPQDTRTSDSAKRNSLAPSNKEDDTMRGQYGIHRLAPEQETTLAALLAKVEEWDFDVFELHRVTAGQPLVPLVMTICHRHEFFDRFRVRPDKLAKALNTLQAGYAAVPYHNRLHATDVTQTLYTLLLCDKVAEHVNELHLFAAVLAAAVHGAHTRATRGARPPASRARPASRAPHARETPRVARARQTLATPALTTCTT